MKLKYRLPLYFLLVVAILTLLNSFLILQTTDDRFRTFIFSGDSSKAEVYAGLLSEYFEDQGSWDNVQTFIMELPEMITKNLDEGMFGTIKSFSESHYYQPMVENLFSNRVVLADTEGYIVADSAGKLIGTSHPQRHLSHGIPIMTVQGKKGVILVGSMVDTSLTDTDELFLASIKRSLLYSSFFSVLIALAVGIMLSIHLTKPMAELAQRAREIALGNLSTPMDIKGNDELAELSQAFNEMITELKKLDTAKKQVIADAAHELRTPVTLIQGTIEGMLDGILSFDQENLKSVLEEVLRLSLLIETLRELELIDAGELKLSKEPIDIRSLLSKSLALFVPVANEKEITISFKPCLGNPATTYGDFFRLREVVDNLISNAIKYTPTGGHIQIQEEKPAKNLVRFSIDDSGPGIDISERERVFERFYRIDKSRSSASGGRGLGLAISSEIVKAHGGKITIGSSDLGGARFCVDLPVRNT
ncbi:signal transduction histidine kinase [Sphaerochaeta pleomorpha str. Grapes]|uniref:histidine kinase n=1 Tax=Sphaerochaeta pleomorpha (strain ATCC BAA-1885 / DSM 22778 / Grapes) TaxID=158190 RepID=G8QV79_SPHPG|nr:ATP-binding protein [Sphaerochaeta pleomorpha]AEV30394.1 signal transduction histidine kinase [Sphaerochaeta pleomorpha str. Grapes]